MSLTWFITPYDPKHWEDPNDTREKPTSDLRVDSAALYAYLAKRWRDIVFYADSQTFYHMYDIENPDGTTLWIRLYHHDQIIAINNNPTPFFFDFILTYRAFVLPAYQLFFFKSSDWESLELNQDTTQGHIKRFMRYKD